MRVDRDAHIGDWEDAERDLWKNEHIEDLIKARAALVECRREAAKDVDVAYAVKAGKDFIEIQGMIEAVDKALEDERAARRSEQFEKGQAIDAPPRRSHVLEAVARQLKVTATRRPSARNRTRMAHSGS